MQASAVIRYLEGSGVPMGAWARRLGVHRVTMERIKLGDRRLLGGPAFQRLVALVEAHKAQQWKWVQKGPRSYAASWVWEGYAPFEVLQPGKMQVAIGPGGPRLAYG